MSGQWRGVLGGLLRFSACRMILWPLRGCMTSGTHLMWWARASIRSTVHAISAAGVDEAVIRLVACHSCAPIEAKVRGLDVELASEFVSGDLALADALLSGTAAQRSLVFCTGSAQNFLSVGRLIQCRS
jgi:hypothetical protein